MNKAISKMLCGFFLTAIALTGCRSAPSTETPAPVQNIVASKGTSAPAPKATPLTRTASQNLGLTILKTLNAAPALKGHKISVGTSQDTVSLDGSVKSAAQKQAAERIATQKAKGLKIVNRLKVEAK